ncbi:MAG TPA: cyclic nucleotide-binding domain-containing protein [Armatimonadota bacterium]|nr:cyclic nucleotide-binding domain-containing protein [Armatimonadota bacterium]HQK92718.1 cyclic nucleotide-binding domain-containing protein [Armatimonadota bacterium]
MGSESGLGGQIAFLRTVPLLRHARLADLEALAGWASERTYGRGQIIFREGQPGRELYIVRSGEVIVSQRLRGRVENVIARFGPREFLGELGWITGSPRTATAQAHCDSTLIHVPGERLFEVIETAPETACRLLLALAEEFAERISETNQRLRQAVLWGLDATGYPDDAVPPGEVT